MRLTAVLTPAEVGGFIALNPETGTTTEGENIEEALENLKEATALYLEEFPKNLVQGSYQCLSRESPQTQPNAAVVRVFAARESAS
jgi:predicted RNase H-like HicB family nuclease